MLGTLAALGITIFTGEPPDRIALVIANSDYVSMTDLSNPGNDAAAVSEVLEAHGFHVILVSDRGRDGLRDAISLFATATAEADIAVAYYAGHGVSLCGQTLILPIDAHTQTDPEEMAGSGVALSLLAEAVSAADAGLVFYDSDRFDPWQEAGGSCAAAEGIAPVGHGSGKLFVGYATSAGEHAQDGPHGGTSPYAAAFVEAMSGPPMDVRLMFGAMSEAVAAATGGEMHPVMHSSLGADPVVLNSAAPAAD